MSVYNFIDTIDSDYKKILDIAPSVCIKIEAKGEKTSKVVHLTNGKFYYDSVFSRTFTQISIFSVDYFVRLYIVNEKPGKKQASFKLKSVTSKEIENKIQKAVERCKDEKVRDALLFFKEEIITFILKNFNHKYECMFFLKEDD